jgi:EmrB/QacA subfamily drug resistance transporter
MTMFTRRPDRDVAPHPAGTTPSSRAAAPWVLAATILASSMAFIDGTVVNIALPALQSSLGATVQDAQWVVEAFALFLAALLLVGGAAGDRFGRRRVFALGVIVFTAASAWCGFATDITQLITARAIQGVGGALLVPGSLAIITASFSEKERGKAIGTWSGYSAITAALGPVLGGFLIDHLSWRYAFLINIPIGVAVVLLTYRHVPESRSESSAGPLDWKGGALATIALGGAVFALIESSNRGWGDWMVLAALGLGLLASVAFVAIERRHPAPMLPFRLFRSRNFTGANALTLLLYAALGGSLFFVPLNLIQVQGYSAAASGAALLPFILCMFLLSRWAGGLVDRYGPKRPLMIGPTIAGLGFALFALPGIGGSYWLTVFPAVLVLGFGMTVSVAPLTTTVMNAVDTSDAGVASGINNAVSRVAALLAVAVFGIVMTQLFTPSLERRVVAGHVPAATVQAVEAQRNRLAAIEVPSETDPQTKQAVKLAIGESFVLGYRAVMLLGALMAFAAAAVALALIEDRKPASP